MTLIVGIRCKEGVVIAADSRATLGSLGNRTARQNISKLDLPTDQVIVGISGFVGLGQKILRSLDKDLWNQVKGKNTNHLKARKLIRDKMWTQVEPEFEAAAKSAKVIGHLAHSSAICHTLIATPIENNPILLQYDHQCASEEATNQLPFMSIGSGSIYADPFLAFLRKSLWSNGEPKNVGEAVLVAIWTLDYVIELDPTGSVGGNVEIATLTKVNNEWKAEMVLEHIISEHRQYYSEGIKEMVKYFNPE